MTPGEAFFVGWVAGLIFGFGIVMMLTSKEGGPRG